MQKNKSPLTVSQALKVYTGTGLAGTVAGLALFEILFYVGAFAGMMTVIALSEGTSYFETVENITQTPALDCMMAFMPALINCLVLFIRHDKNAAGGKLFRTFKGGYGTFVRSRIGIYISAVLAALIFCLFACLLDIIGIVKTQNSIAAETAVFVSSLAALGAGTLCLLIRNDTLRGFISVIVCFAVSEGGAVLLNILFSLKAGMLPHIIVGIVGASIMVLAAKIYLSYYRKNLWV